MRCDQFYDGSVSRRKASQQPACHPLPSPGVSWRPAPGLTSLPPGRAWLERRGLAPEKPPAGYPWVRITCCNQEPGATRCGFLERSWELYSFLWVQTRDVSCFKCFLVWEKLRHLICSGQRGTCSGRREDLGSRPCRPNFFSLSEASDRRHSGRHLGRLWDGDALRAAQCAAPRGSSSAGGASGDTGQQRRGGKVSGRGAGWEATCRLTGRQKAPAGPGAPGEETCT